VVLCTLVAEIWAFAKNAKRNEEVSGFKRVDVYYLLALSSLQSSYLLNQIFVSQCPSPVRCLCDDSYVTK
jgi:hypothetical protein